MIIPAHKRTIYINDITFSVKEKFLLNLPELKFIKDVDSYRCLALKDGIQHLPPFLNCSSYGIICFGSDQPSNEKEAVERFFTTSFNFDAYDSMLLDYRGDGSGMMIDFIEWVIAFYRNWEKTGKVNLRQI